MIIQLTPRADWTGLDIIIEEQAAYYGQHNAHVIAFRRACDAPGLFLYRKLEH